VERFDLALASPRVGPEAALAELTSFRIGGRPGRLVDCFDQAELVAAVRQTDRAGGPLLVIGGGSNLLAGEELGGLTVVRDRRGAVRAEADGREIRLTADAGASWDGLVELTVERGWAGLAPLSGIPGSVGASPVQNIGAYGAEVAQVVESARVFDRRADAVVELRAEQFGFAYRDSALKRSMAESARPTPRWVVLDVTFRLDSWCPQMPVAYPGLASALGLAMGERAPLAAIRRAVLAIRRGKGMVLDAADRDTWSAGSFFTNPLVSADVAAALPPRAPRFAAAGGLVKVSAAWLITASGIERGQGLRPGAPAATSSKHVLALTNRGGATYDDVLALAAWITARVEARFGIRLTPEPVRIPPIAPAPA
jgi:UDP-N-acetylmuramate dehydrogenase